MVQWLIYSSHWDGHDDSEEEESVLDEIDLDDMFFDDTNDVTD